jgi:hypothetical protein
LPAPARALAAASTSAVTAALAADHEAFSEASAQLAALDPEPVRRVLAAVVRDLLQDLHPDGLSGDDLQAAIEDCLRSAAGWFPRADASVLVVVLTGALSAHPADEEQPQPPAGLEVVRHAVLLVAVLLTASGGSFGSYLDAAFAEIAAAELTEQP